MLSVPRILKKEKGFNLHHIIPKSLGGSDEETNLIKLTIREHYIAHLILWKGCGGPMTFAFIRLIRSKKLKFGLTSRQVTMLKASVIFSKEHRQKISDANRGKKRSKEACRKLSEAHKGLTQSEETIQKRKATLLMRSYYPSEETRKKISEGLKGRFYSEETRAKISAALRGRPNLALSKAVRCITLNKIFASATFASKETGASRECIAYCCRGEQKFTGKGTQRLQWEYV
jgi:hypothetical protein